MKIFLSTIKINLDSTDEMSTVDNSTVQVVWTPKGSNLENSIELKLKRENKINPLL